MLKQTAALLRTADSRKMLRPLLVAGCVAVSSSFVCAADTNDFTLQPKVPQAANNSADNSAVQSNHDKPASSTTDDAATTPRYLASSSGRRFLHAGTWELTLAGTGNNDANFRNGGLGANIGIGYFPIDGLEIGVRQNIAYNDGGSGSSWNGTTRGALDYHFDLDRFQPYIGANIGYTYGDTISDTWEAGPEGGVKYFIKEEAFLYGQAEYQVFFRNANGFGNHFSDGQWVYTVGVGFTF